MTTDDELLAEVRVVLADEVADVTAGPAMLAAVRRSYGRSWLWRRLVIAVPVVVAAGVAAAMVLAPSATPLPAPTPGPSPDPGVPANAAYVMRKTSQALDTVRDNVVYERAIVGDNEKYSEPGKQALNERWLAADGSAFRFRATIDGRTVVDLSRDTVSDVFVDYRDHTYRVSPGVEPNAPEDDDVWTPEEIQQGLADGRFTVLGPAEVDGKPTVKLHHEPRKTETPTDLWVDATTYLPVRWQWQQDGSTPFDVTWLPPTPENLAQLKTVIPPGFTQN